MWTLEYNGEEKPLHEWGIVGNLPFEFVSQQTSSVHLVTTDRFGAGFTFAFDQPVIIRRDRVGSGEAWSGGSIWFQGFVAKPGKIADGPRQNHRYSLHCAWSILERIQFQQARKLFAGYTIPGDTTTAPTFTTVFTSEIILGEDVNEARITNGQQIAEAIAWANECYNPTRRGNTVGVDPAMDLLQVGTIGVSVPICKYPTRDLKVAEVIRQMLRWSQDAIAYFDWSTTPPTFHVKKLAALPVVTVNTSVDRFRRLELYPRHDRVLPGVIIRYKKTKQLDGNTWTDVFTDKYPLALSEHSPFASVHTIDLVGSQQNTEEAPVVCAPMLAKHATEATRVAWWKQYDDSLKDPTIVPASLKVTVADVVDMAGAPVSLADVPNKLELGSLADWMTEGGSPVAGVEATVSAKVSYTKRKAGVATDFEVATLKPIHTRVTLTNAVSRTYSTTTYFDPGETIPEGLAQAIYEGFSVLQYEGSPTLVDTEINGNISLGKKLTIVTPDQTFASILIQGVSGELHSRTITPRLGPPSQVGLTDTIEILRASRHRLIFQLPSNRGSGKAGAGSKLSLGNRTPRENTFGGIAEKQLRAVAGPMDPESGDTVMISTDAADGSLTMREVDADGATVPTKPSVIAKLDDLTEAANKEAKFRWLHFHDPSNGNAGSKIKVLATAAEPSELPPPATGGMRFVGEYSAEFVYALQDVVVIRTGPNAGCYVKVAGPEIPALEPVAPYGGTYWVMLSKGDTVGVWT